MKQRAEAHALDRRDQKAQEPAFGAGFQASRANELRRLSVLQQDFQGPQRVLFLGASSAPQTLCIGQVPLNAKKTSEHDRFLSLMPQVCMKGNHALTWRLANSQAEKPASDSSKPETKSTETYARCAGKELKMRFKARSLLLGTYLMAGILAANVPVEARTTTGWNSFRVWSPIGADNCVGESFGASVNVCRSNINLTFELLVDTPGEKTVTVMDNPDGYGVLTCAAVAFSGQDGGLVSSYPQTFNPSGQETLTFHVTVSPGWGLSLYCWDVSPTKGIATIKWNP